MTGLEPHPIFPLPTAEWVRTYGEEAARKYLSERLRRMELEAEDPLNNGFEPEIWHVVDDLLVDGNHVILDLTRIARLMPEGMAPTDMVDVPKEIYGAPEVWIGGSQRSSKSEYAGKKCMKVLEKLEGARGWSFADTGPISIARQQPIFWRYMPPEVKRLAAASGKARAGAILNVSYKQKTGFAEQSFVLPNGSQHWFKNYEQDIENVEGDQLDVIWLDELRNPLLLKTLRYRMGDRSGIVIVTFTSIDDNYSAIVNEYDRGSRMVLEVPAELLPIKRPKPISAGNSFLGVHNLAHTRAQTQKGPEEPGSPAENFNNHNTPEAKQVAENAFNGGGGTPGAPAEQLEVIAYKKVPRIKVAGPGSDGDQKANIVYFHITDNPYYGFKARPRPGEKQLSGKERFYKILRGATESKILARAYGILTRSSLQQFPKFNQAVHVVDPEAIPRKGRNHHVVDPCDGRNWAMIWPRIDRVGDLWIYREWPSTGHPGAYIQGIGDPGPWTLPGQAADGIKGPAQSPFGFGLRRYKQEILRLEGHPEEGQVIPGELREVNRSQDVTLWRRAPNPLHSHLQQVEAAPAQGGPEEIDDRWMDSRYGNRPTNTKEGKTTLIEQMEELDMQFLAASGAQIEEGTALINDWLDYDQERPLGEYSPQMARLNRPRLHISRNCPNLIYALQEWTGRDGQKGACKDWIDLLRYFLLTGAAQHIGEDAYTWQGGGSY